MKKSKKSITFESALRVFFLYLFGSLCNTASAQWWNPLAPKNYEDCILKNMKDVSGDDATQAIKDACRQKFPQELDANDRRILEKLAQESKLKDAEYEKCGIRSNNRQDYHFLFSLGEGTPAQNAVTQNILNQLNNKLYDYLERTIGFQNNNNFGISAVRIGFTKLKQCTQKQSEYTYTTVCTNNWPTTPRTSHGVPPNTYGTLSCGKLPRQANSLGMCIIGYSPIYNPFDDSLLDFLRSVKSCQ